MVKYSQNFNNKSMQYTSLSHDKMGSFTTYATFGIWDRTTTSIAEVSIAYLIRSVENDINKNYW